MKYFHYPQSFTLIIDLKFIFQFYWKSLYSFSQKSSWHYLRWTMPYPNTLWRVSEAKQANFGQTSMQRTPLYSRHFFEFQMVSAIEIFHSTNLIRQAIDMFYWDRAFVNTIVDEKVFNFNKTILNTLSNFVLQETLTVYDQKKNKNIIQEKNNVYKSYRKY